MIDNGSSLYLQDSPTVGVSFPLKFDKQGNCVNLIIQVRNG